MRQDRQEFVLRGDRRAQLRRRLFVLMRTVRLAQNRVTKDLEQLAFDSKASAWHRAFAANHVPEAREWNPRIGGGAFDGGRLGQNDEVIATHCGSTGFFV